VSDTDSTTTASEQPVTEATAPSPTPAPEGSGSGDAGAEGFVPLADFEFEQARARAFQGEADRLKAQLAASAPPPPKDEDASGGFDPDSFRRSLLQDVVSVSQIAQAAPALRSQFPHADPAIFADLSAYGSVDALRVVAENSHRRVAEAVAASTDRSAIEAEVRAEYEAKYGQGAGTPQSGASTAQAGDPSPEQLNSLTMDEWNALEERDPGVIKRVLRSVA
jgi:hypothetical protein